MVRIVHHGGYGGGSRLVDGVGNEERQKRKLSDGLRELTNCEVDLRVGAPIKRSSPAATAFSMASAPTATCAGIAIKITKTTRWMVRTLGKAGITRRRSELSSIKLKP